MNVVAISSTLNTAPIGAEKPAPGCDPSLSFLTGAEKVYATNLIGDWQRQLQHLDGALPKTCKGRKSETYLRKTRPRTGYLSSTPVKIIVVREPKRG